jgi:prepilin-type N-terminal cleavage/methylation domain-containing protein/prepilin-type processing-associated H-X9-DG protein
MKSISTSFGYAGTRRPAFTLVELLVVIAIIGVLAALLLPLLSRTKAKAKNVTCVSQLRQLGIAARLYAEDNSALLPIAERLPSLPLNPDKTLPRICDALGPYTGKTGGTNSSTPVFKCPADLEEFFEVEGSSYMWNAGLNDQRIDLGEDRRIHASAFNATNVIWSLDTNVVHAVESTPLFSDYDNFHPRPPKPGKNVVFMDGHVALPNVRVPSPNE